MNITEFKDKLNDWSLDLSDGDADTDKMKLHDDWMLSFSAEDENLTEMIGSSEAGYFDSAVLVSDTGILNEHAASQIASRLGIPAQWIRDDVKCPEELRKLVMNYKLFNTDNQQLMIRKRRDEIRAVLSQQYTPFDNHKLMNATFEALKQNDMLGGIEVVKQSIGDTMRAYLVFKSVRFDGDSNAPMSDGGGSGGLHPAVYLSNSEIGTGSARIHGGLLRSYCTNGLIAGWKSDNAFRITHRFKSESQIIMLANEAIAAALQLSEEAGVKFIESQHKLLQITDLKSITSKWAKKYDIGIERRDNWLEALTARHNEIGRTSVADVINEATYTANRIESQELAETFERMAGAMLFAEVERSA